MKTSPQKFELKFIPESLIEKAEQLIEDEVSKHESNHIEVSDIHKLQQYSSMNNYMKEFKLNHEMSI